MVIFSKHGDLIRSNASTATLGRKNVYKYFWETTINRDIVVANIATPSHTQTNPL